MADCAHHHGTQGTVLKLDRDLPARWHALARGWGSVGAAYLLAALAATGAAHPLHESALDAAVPFAPWAVWAYLSFFAFVPLGYLAAPTPRLPRLERAMQACALVAAIVFLAWPTTVALAPPLAASGAAAWAMDLVRQVDSPRNCLPSLHAALTLLTVCAVAQRRRPWRTLAVASWGAAIVAAIVMTRRHLAVDIGAGLALAATAWAAVPRGRAVTARYAKAADA